MSPRAHRVPLRRARFARFAHAAALLVAAALCGSAHAQAIVGANASVAPDAAIGVTGALAVNEAAGLNNAQANQLTITDGGAVGNLNLNAQHASGSAVVTTARASIGANAFSNASGAVMVNQSAGAGNVQSNSAQLGTAAIGVEAVSDVVLSAAAATNGGRGRSAEAQGIREASIGNTAFANATGLVQINQAAGAGNVTANSFVLRPPAGTLF
ncbi:hypothetical protein SAMN05445871_1218 [Paraburkholderia caballeronis]|uniref:Extended Signal Peptide of Type V secretion system n=1 Tax=Paraburkholderia caballeronis TaxID=416943 RepID=A0A1H7UNQ4_9BURK|nr:hypothetical protein C7403_104476 [Paraburkholderia caballeronis]PXX02141.1 hypothetical protein C7407_104475 [Paraburkholderia caballeronis]RAK01298.1 hypothetical protein C7409_104475 [Paraburkholderia caballeronis]SEB86575.1 hypothetical protein SAMN05445871_1218 [Paraburkholderia caballeronis]SEL98268.1 hypothetical protein SAMN05192542_1208 [Paraburkholderia caballeronis]